MKRHCKKHWMFHDNCLDCQKANTAEDAGVTQATPVVTHNTTTVIHEYHDDSPSLLDTMVTAAVVSDMFSSSDSSSSDCSSPDTSSSVDTSSSDTSSFDSGGSFGGDSGGAGSSGDW